MCRVAVARKTKAEVKCVTVVEKEGGGYQSVRIVGKTEDGGS